MSRGMEMILWTSVAILAWGFWGIFGKLSTARIGMQAVFWTQLITVLGAITFLLFSRSLLPLAPDGRGILFGLAAGLTTLAAIIAFFTLLHRNFPVSIVYPLTSLYPLVTVAVGVLVLGEAITPLKVTGVILAVLAMVLLAT